MLQIPELTTDEQPCSVLQSLRLQRTLLSPGPFAIFKSFNIPPSCNYSLQIRHASLERLLERLLDIRFLSADFLNTFLITYRVYTSASALLDTLLQFYYSHNAKDYPLYLATDVFSPVSRKVRSVSLPTEALSPRQDKKKGNTMLLQ